MQHWQFNLFCAVMIQQMLFLTNIDGFPTSRMLVEIFLGGRIFIFFQGEARTLIMSFDGQLKNKKGPPKTLFLNQIGQAPPPPFREWLFAQAQATVSMSFNFPINLCLNRKRLKFTLHIASSTLARNSKPCSTG